MNQALPASTDSFWAECSKPLAAFLRAGPRPMRECARFCEARGGSKLLAQNVLSWLTLEGFARCASGVVELSAAGLSWLGDFFVDVTLPDEASAPQRSRRSGGSERRARDIREWTYGTLHPMEIVGRTGCGHALWLCACECGETCVVRARHLRDGNTKTCGARTPEAVAIHRESSFVQVGGLQ